MPGKSSSNQSIRQGDIFWLQLDDEAFGSEPAFRRPFVVAQNNIFLASRINTVLVCAITSNLKRAADPGNFLVRKSEASAALTADSVVNITQLITVNRADLTHKIGSLSKNQINKLVSGIKLLIEPAEI